MLRTTRTSLLCITAITAIAFLTPDARAEKRLLRLMFNAAVTEAPSASELDFLMSGDKPRTLRDWVNLIDKASKDPKIDGALMFVSSPTVGISQIEELTRAIKRFQARGKKVWCFLDHAGNGAYALASAADHISLTENGSLDVIGLNAQLMYFKGLFDKVGIVADMLHCGDYKSALEPYTRTEPSPEAAEQINWLLDGIYEGFVSLIAEGRGLSPSDVKNGIDNAPLDANAALKRDFIDAVATLPAFKKMVRKEYGKDVEIVTDYGSSRPEFDLEMTNPFAMFKKIQELFSPIVKGEEDPGIAIVYVEGAIVTGRTEQGLFGAGGTVGSSTVRAALENARTDDSIKAVVLRVNSPGGSALASDIMWDAATRCAAEKPLIVSMGNVAGSGGYYVSIPGDVIFAEKTTITGSIGVVGGKLVFKGLTDWAGLSFTEFKRGNHADLYSTNRVWTDDERKWVQDYMVSVYEQFKGRVMESRGKRIKGDLEKLAGGRVYTGTQALELGLIDKIGGLDDAIKYAARKADLGIDYEVRVFPKPKGLAEILAQLFGESGEDVWEVASPKLTLFGNHPFMQHFLPILEQLAPDQAAQLLKGLHNALILNDEHVGMFMPFELNIR